MKISILINTHNQQPYLKRALDSCLSQDYNNFEIIIVDTSPIKDEGLRSSYSENLKVKFIDLEKQYSHPEQDQLFKITKGIEESTGEYICLLDGDDFFKSNKLSYLKNIILKENIFFNQDLPTLYSELQKKIVGELNCKKYKRYKFYKLLINDWPFVYGTSSILIKKKLLEEFFEKTNPFKWKYLAIDIQLVIYCYKYSNISSFGKKITLKSKNKSNLGDIYLNILKKIFWIRRSEQHDFYLELNKKNKLFNGFDYYLTKIICALIK